MHWATLHFIPITLLLLLQLLIALQTDVKACSNSFFITSRGRRLIGSTIDRLPASSLNECLEKCRANTVCRGTNYLLDNDSPMCSLVDTNGANSSLRYTDDASIIYSAELACHALDNIECSRQWAFEWTPRTAIVTQELVANTLPGLDREKCLDECARRVSTCRAALFNGQTNECRLSLIGPHTVHSVEQHFKDDVQWDLYESNCRDEQLDKRKCQYLVVKSAGFVDVFDAKFEPVVDAEQCQARCVTWPDGTCRSYTFDSTNRVCFVSHSTSRVLGKNPLDIRQKHLTTADLDDCVDFDLKCQQDAMLIRGSAMKLFTGTIRAKHEKSYFCDKNIKNSFDFETKIPYGECGTEKQSQPIPTYSNLMFVKEGSTQLVTVRDKLLQVLCRLHDAGEDLTVSYRLDILGNETVSDNPVRLVTPQHPFLIKPKYQLTVLTKDLRTADIVTVGDTGYILVTVDHESEESGLDFEVTDLVAQDVNGKTIKLLDSDGCPISSDTVLNIEKHFDGKLRLKIKFEGFPDSAEVVYKGLVKPCLTQCSRDCGGKKNAGFKTDPIVRVRRSSSDYNPRQYYMAQDLYQIKSAGGVRLTIGPTGEPQVIDLNRPVRLPQLMHLLNLNSTNGRDMVEEYDSLDVSARPVPSRLVMCLTQNPSCLFTVLLAVLQCFLVFFCACIVYFYVRQWRECSRIRRLRRLNQEAMAINAVQYQFASPSEKHAAAENNHT